MADVTPASLLRQLIARQDLSIEQARAAFDAIMDGQWSQAQVAAVLVALAAKGETVDEFTGAALAMRARVVPVAVNGQPVLDTCGTGGTGISTFNISTAAALVAAGAGAKVAKHGNRTHTRVSGSANLLAELGVNLDCTAETEARCLAEAGVCFCFAVRHHPAMKHAAPVRQQLGVRTIFNILGPLTNPAGARRQLMGVPADELTETIARVLAALGGQRAMVVHSADGLDELSTTAPARVAELCEGRVTMQTLDARQFGLPPARLEDLLVDSAASSAKVVQGVLAGRPGPARDIVLYNAAAALVVAGLAADIPAGLRQAAVSIDTGAAAAALEKLARISHES